MQRPRREWYQGESEEAMVNLTPLIDVVFIVLIVFILLSPVIQLEKIELARGGQDRLDTSSEKLLIYVHSDDTVRYRDQVLSRSQLVKELQKDYLLHQNKVPQLVQDTKSSFGMYQSVKSAVQEAGFEQLEVILQP